MRKPSHSHNGSDNMWRRGERWRRSAAASNVGGTGIANAAKQASNFVRLTFNKPDDRDGTFEHRVVDPAVEVNEAADAELLLGGEATRGRRRAGGLTIGAVRQAALAPGVVRQALHHVALRIGDDGNRAEMIGVEIMGAVGANWCSAIRRSGRVTADYACG
jgi:hypothetical protein